MPTPLPLLEVSRTRMARPERTPRKAFRPEIPPADLPRRRGDSPSLRFRHGCSALRAGNYKSAAMNFELACLGEPNHARFEAYWAWALYLGLRGRAIEGGAGVVELYLRGADERGCKRKIQSAVAALPYFDMGHVFLGRIHLDGGSYDRAEHAFRTALRINGKNEQAIRYLRVATRRHRKSGIFGRVVDWFSGAKKAS